MLKVKFSGVLASACSSCGGRMKLVAMRTEPTSVPRYLAAVGGAHRRAGRGLPVLAAGLTRARVVATKPAKVACRVP